MSLLSGKSKFASPAESLCWVLEENILSAVKYWFNPGRHMAEKLLNGT